MGINPSESSSPKSDSAEPYADRRMRGLTGHCQVCERAFGMWSTRIPRHGFKRDGRRETQACAGSREFPIEASFDALNRYLYGVSGEYDAASEALLRHQDKLLTVPNRDAGPDFFPRSPGYSARRSEYLSELEQRRARALAEMQYQRARIDGWSPRELQATRREESAVARERREAERRARRAARRSREQAQIAKLAEKYRVACEFALDTSGNQLFCWTHGRKVERPKYERLQRRVTGAPCFKKAFFERSGIG